MIGYFALALVGGLVLNVMPCVLPVLTLKAFHAVEHSQHDPRMRRRHGWAYAAGTVSLYMAFAIILVVIKASGKQLGWGMQWQHPPFVAIMITIVFAFALNSLGVFEILLSAQGKEGENDKIWGSLVNGWFAAIMSTPCSAPFLGTAIAFALSSEVSSWQTIVIFTLIGVGLAIPYFLLTQVPAFARMLPKPGAWMESVKQVMGFTLLGTTVWLYGTLQAQITPGAANWFLGFLLVLAMVLWAGHKFGGIQYSQARQWAFRAGGIAVLILAWRGMVSFEKPALAEGGEMATTEPVVKNGRINWTPYNGSRLKKENGRNRPVFMDFTAEWCASCKANEKAFLETDLVRGTLERLDILPMKADMTNENEELEEIETKKLGRNGIPIYVIWMPDGTYDLLPVTITAQMVVDHLESAAKRFPNSKYALN